MYIKKPDSFPWLGTVVYIGGTWSYMERRLREVCKKNSYDYTPFDMGYLITHNRTKMIISIYQNHLENGYLFDIRNYLTIGRESYSQMLENFVRDLKTN